VHGALFEKRSTAASSSVAGRSFIPRLAMRSASSASMVRRPSDISTERTRLSRKRATA
jgi:hypothetical protein